MERAESIPESCTVDRFVFYVDSGSNYTDIRPSAMGLLFLRCTVELGGMSDDEERGGQKVISEIEL